MSKKVLVIGGSGFTGRHVLQEMIRRGMDVYAMQHHTPLPDMEGIKIIKGGIGDVNRRLLDSVRPDTVFHLARPKFPLLRRAGRNLAARWAAFQNQRLIREMERPGHPARLVFASGSLMYGSSPHPHDEDAPLKPISFARQYYRGEIPVLNAIEAGKIPVTVIRFPWLLGKGSWFEWFYLRAMNQYQAIPLFGDGNNLMEIIDIQDAARLALQVTDDPQTRGIINLVSSGAVTQLEFVSVLSSVSGLPVKDYREVFHRSPEKEAIQAFTSGIVLATKYSALTTGFRYTSLEDSLRRILSE
jgi:nucleoside-diphosphate-sugar epimerase